MKEKYGIGKGSIMDLLKYNNDKRKNTNTKNDLIRTQRQKHMRTE